MFCLYAGEEEAVKVLEMEEAEKMEKSLSKKVQDTVKGLRETLGGMKTPTKVNISIPSLQKSAAGCGSDVNLPTASAVSFMEGNTEPVDSVVQPPVGAVKAVFTATTPVQPGLKRKAEKSTKKARRKGKGNPPPVMLGQPPCLAESPLQVNVSNTVLPAGGGIPAETTPPLKLKLVLSPNKEVPLCETMDVISPSAYVMELDDGGGVLPIAEPASAPKKVSAQLQ
jgi:hypothetical protein